MAIKTANTDFLICLFLEDGALDATNCIARHLTSSRRVAHCTQVQPGGDLANYEALVKKTRQKGG